MDVSWRGTVTLVCAADVVPVILGVQVAQDMKFHYSRVGLIMIQHTTRLTSICKPHFGAQTR